MAAFLFLRYVDSKVAFYRQQGANEGDIASYVGRDLEEYFSSVAQILRKGQELQMPQSLIEETTWNTIKEFLELAALKLERNYGNPAVVALSWHLQQYKERTTLGGKFLYPHIYNVHQTYERERRFVSKNENYL